MSNTIELPNATLEPSGHQLFRDVNRRVRELLDGTQSEVYFFCECVDERCAAVLPMTGPEYDALCREPDSYAVLDGHDDPDLDVLVGQNDRYAIVRSFPPADAVDR